MQVYAIFEQDKLIFKDFIEEETKFRYVEKLFFLDIDASKNTDENILNFIKTLNNFQHIKSSFLLVKKINKLKLKENLRDKSLYVPEGYSTDHNRDLHRMYKQVPKNPATGKPLLRSNSAVKMM